MNATGALAGTTYRVSPEAISVVDAKAGAKVDILVENMGRINYGHGMTDPKVRMGRAKGPGWGGSRTLRVTPGNSDGVLLISYAPPLNFRVACAFFSRVCWAQ